MFAKNFSTVRNLILKTSSVILEDDSGIPFDYFSQKDWTLREFGTYTKPVDLFKQYYQPSLRQWYVANAPLPIDLRIRLSVESAGLGHHLGDLFRPTLIPSHKRKRIPVLLSPISTSG